METSNFRFVHFPIFNMSFFRNRIKKIVVSSKRTLYRFRSLLLVNCLLFSQVNAAFEDIDACTAHASMAGAGVAQSFGPASLFVNPALIGGMRGIAAGFYHPFGISEIHAMHAAFSYPLEKVTMAAAASVYGNKIYAEQLFHTVAILPVTSKFAIALDACAGNLSIRDYGTDWTYWLNAGFHFQFSQNLAWGASIKNTNYAAIGVNREALPQIIQTGICYTAAPRLHINLDLYKDSNFPLDMIAGLCFDWFDNFCIRMGLGNEPSRMAAGFSLKLVNLSIDYAYLNKTDLAATHLFSVQLFSVGGRHGK